MRACGSFGCTLGYILRGCADERLPRRPPPFGVAVPMQGAGSQRCERRASSGGAVRSGGPAAGVRGGGYLSTNFSRRPRGES